MANIKWNLINTFRYSDKNIPLTSNHSNTTCVCMLHIPFSSQHATDCNVSGKTYNLYRNKISCNKYILFFFYTKYFTEGNCNCATDFVCLKNNSFKNENKE